MTIHYHGTPITPNSKMGAMVGRHFCVSFANPSQVQLCHEIGQSVMLDNGAFSFWKSDKSVGWPGYYSWCERWLDYPTTWCVIPDVIGGSEEQNDQLIREWFQTRLPKGAPVWHMHEPIERLRRLCAGYERVCIGSSAEYSQVGSDKWHRRMETAMNIVCTDRTPWLHMLRGMALCDGPYPFASVDSTDIARNHYLQRNDITEMVNRWDQKQCPPKWIIKEQQMLFDPVTWTMKPTSELDSQTRN